MVSAILGFGYLEGDGVVWRIGRTCIDLGMLSVCSLWSNFDSGA